MFFRFYKGEKIVFVKLTYYEAGSQLQLVKNNSCSPFVTDLKKGGISQFNCFFLLSQNF